MVRLDLDKTVVLVDLSYYVIYRYHALHKWFDMSDTPCDETTFLAKYEKLFVSHLHNMTKKLKVSPTNVVLVGDCPRRDIWRMGICAEYKASRDEYWEKNPIKENISPLIKQSIIPTLVQTKGFQHISVARLEADDVVYCIKRRLHEAGFEGKLIIITNDNDYLQLIGPNVDVVNLPSFKSIADRHMACPRKDLLLKILGGDPSDNIPRVCTKAKVVKYLRSDDCDTSEEAVREFVLANKGDSQRYDMNCRLIRMDRIPEALQEMVTIEFETKDA